MVLARIISWKCGSRRQFTVGEGVGRSQEVHIGSKDYCFKIFVGKETRERWWELKHEPE